MGVVYAAHDAIIDRKVAIKLVRADLLDGQERQDYIDRFQQEAKAVGRCNHPGIVAIFDYALHEQNPYLVMEFVDGISLQDAIADGRCLEPKAAIHVMALVLDALSYAHRQGIVHRDVKPANILLMNGGSAKVTDFGIARIESSSLTLDGSTLGTPRYMSPEQYLGGQIDARSDLFSVAVVLQELLIGERPFPGRNLSEIACKLLRDAPAGGDKLDAVVGSAVTGVIQRALAKNPEDRYASADAMARALRAANSDAAVESTCAEIIDQTVVAVRASKQSVDLQGAGSVALDQQSLTSIELRLAERVGPIARVLMQKSLKGTASAEALCDELAQRIVDATERREFLTEALAIVRERSTLVPRPTTDALTQVPESSAPITPEEIELARRALAEVLGPIARVLVQRTLGKARSRAELWSLLASHIEPAEDRAAFLRRRTGTGVGG